MAGKNEKTVGDSRWNGGGGEKAYYLYCLALPRLVPEGGKGFSGPLLIHRSDSIAAVVEIVSVDDFRGAAGDANMNDFSWLIPRTLVHEMVVERVMESSPVVPARFATIFPSIDRLRFFMTLNRKTIMKFFLEIEDKTEWTVKGFLNRELARKKEEAGLLEAREPFLSTLSSGRRYFEEKKIISGAHDLVGNRSGSVFRDVLDSLTHHAVNFCDLTILKGLREKNGRDLFLNRAFLVPESSLARFRDCVRLASDHHGAGGFTFELTGPWPPYSFLPPFEYR